MLINMNRAATCPAGTEGFECHIPAIGLVLCVMIRGAGALSIDGAIGR